MDELIERLTAKTGVEAPIAEKAIGIILDFLAKEAPTETVQQLVAQMPGAEALLQSAQAESAAAGASGETGGLMGAASRLMAVGLSMGQVQSVTQELVAYAREKAGEDTVGEIVGAVPGLGQFV